MTWAFHCCSWQLHMKSLSSICQSVRLSLSFLKIRSLFFSDTVHDDSKAWCLVTGIMLYYHLEFGPNGPKSGTKLGYLSFYQVRFISFPWNCIQFWHWKMGKRDQTRPETSFSAILSSLSYYFSLKLYRMIAWNIF